MIFYHGATALRKTWNYKTLGIGNDQFGPGWYFTDNEDTARHYASGPEGIIHRCDINVSRICPNSGNVSRLRSQISKMIKATPDVRYVLENWGENPRDALKAALESIIDNTNGPHDAIQQIWIDFYRKREAIWAVNIVKFFNWSVALPDSSETDGDQFAVVWDPSSITILEVYRP